MRWPWNQSELEPPARARVVATFVSADGTRVRRAQRLPLARFVLIPYLLETAGVSAIDERLPLQSQADLFRSLRYELQFFDDWPHGKIEYHYVEDEP